MVKKQQQHPQLLQAYGLPVVLHPLGLVPPMASVERSLETGFRLHVQNQGFIQGVEGG